MQRSIGELLAVIGRTLARHEMVSEGDRVLVAVSGGPDSTCLLAAFAHLRRRLGITLVAGHVNHRLRGADSEADEQCAASVAARLEVPFVRSELPEPLACGGNLEERARRARYAVLHRLARAEGCRRIATGHTRDDQAETVLLRLLRGSGPAGLIGIEAHRRDGVVRPLIECTRGQVLAALRAWDLPHRFDRSNADVRFQRTRIRREVLPLLRTLSPQVDRNLVQLARMLDAERGIVAAWLEEQRAAAADGGRLRLERLARIPADLRGHLVRKWLVDGGVPHRRLSSRHVEAILRLAAGGAASGRVSLPDGQEARRRYGELELVRALPTAPVEDARGEAILIPGSEVCWGGWRISAGPVEAVRSGVRLPADLTTALCDLESAGVPFVIRPSRRGDRVRPLGLGGSRKLSDVYIDRKIAAGDRWTRPVVAWRDVVVWVPGVVRGEALAVRETTRRIVRLRARREEPGSIAAADGAER